MNKHCRILLTLAGAFLATWGFSSCSWRPSLDTYSLIDKPEYVAGTFEHFVYSTKGYPTTMETYRNHDLLKRATGDSKIYICLSQQRGRIYVDGQVAADWPVSTGVGGRETPTGSFTVIDKKKEYASNTYGNIYNASGRLVKSNADIMKDSVPEGGSFRGSPMPNWMRLTRDGVGMHTGKVKAGQRLSHGCIRTPGHMATQLFDITRIGTHVTVAHEVESCYPNIARQAMVDGAAETAREKAIKDSNAARLKKWETDHPEAARRYAEREAKAKSEAEAKKAGQKPA